MEQKAGAKVRILGMLENFYYCFIYLKRQVQILLMLPGVNCVRVHIVYQDLRSSYSEL